MTTDLDAIIQQCWEDSGQWFPVNTNTREGSEAHVSFLLLALAGEVGESANVWKKHLRGSAGVTETDEKLREELIDVLIYWCNLARVLNINVEEEYARKREFNQSRFGGAATVDVASGADHREGTQEGSQ